MWQKPWNRLNSLRYCWEPGLLLFLLPYSFFCWLSLPKLVFSWLQGGGCSSWHHSLFQGRNNKVVSVTLCLLFSHKLWTSYTPVSHGSSLLKYRLKYSSSTMEPETLHFDWVQRASSASGSWILSSSRSSQKFSFIIWPEFTHRVTSSWEAGRPLPFLALLGESSKKEVQWEVRVSHTRTVHRHWRPQSWVWKSSEWPPLSCPTSL